MGSSEGGLAAARYPGNEFKGRVVIGWSCEKGYFTDNPKIGANKKDPFLNIVGYKDEYFGVDAVWNQNQNKTGNCAQQMSSDGFDKGKIIIYPDGYHNNRENQYIVYDILGFLNYWKGRRVLKD